MIKGTYRKIIFSVFLAAATAAVFWQVRGFEFINLDDVAYIMQNSHVQFGLTPDNFLWAFTTTEMESWQPLVWLSFMLDADLYGNYAGGYHFTNLILHILSGVLLFRLMNRMTGSIWRSAFVAVFFALHPVHVESVAWIAERKDTLSGFFFMLTLFLYAVYVKKPEAKRYATVLISFVFGLMSKPMLVTLPVIFILLDYWPLRRLSGGMPQTSGIFENEAAPDAPRRFAGIIPVRQIKEKLPFFLLAFLCGAAVLLAQMAQNVLTGKDVHPFGARLANAFVSYITYIVNILAPHNLGAFYPFNEHLSVPLVSVCAVLFFALCLAAILLAKRFPFIFVGWFWFVIMLLPVIGLIPLAKHALADRFTYLSSIGLSIILAWGAPALIPSEKMRKRILIPAAVAYMAVLGYFTWVQCGYWANDYTLFTHTLKVTKNNDLMHFNLAQHSIRQGNFEEGKGHLAEALKIDPQNDRYHAGLGLAYFTEGNIEKALFHFNEGLKFNPDNDILHANLGKALEDSGRIPEAAEHYRKAIELNPQLYSPYFYLGMLFLKQGNIDEAETNLRKAVEANPNYEKTHDVLADVLLKKGNLQEAMTQYREVLRINPSNLPALFNLGIMLAKASQLDEAADCYRRAVSLAPDDPRIHYNLGIILSLKGDPAGARRHLQTAVRLKPDYGEAHQALKDLNAKGREAD